jgi:hypothetical protein
MVNRKCRPIGPTVASVQAVLQPILLFNRAKRPQENEVVGLRRELDETYEKFDALYGKYTDALETIGKLQKDQKE